MTLYRINCSSDVLTALSRVSNTESITLAKMQCTRYAVIQQNRMKNLHITNVRRYPEPPTLLLPTNVSEIFANEIGRFTPERTRDIAAPILLYGNNDCRSFFTKQLKTEEHLRCMQNCNDTHVESYDCFGAVSLNGTMQSNVPKPFCSHGKSTHLNMPGGQWTRDEKYIAEDMQKSHYRNIRLPPIKLDKSGLTTYVAMNTHFQTMCIPKYIYSMRYSTKISRPLNKLVEPEEQKEEVIVSLTHLSKKERFKIIVQDYGTTVIVFHIGISLISLGACYAAVAGGVDLTPIIKSFFDMNNEQLEKILNKSSTFLFAYSIHKLMAPIRIAITLGVTPPLVKRLRKMGVLIHKRKIQTTEK